MKKRLPILILAAVAAALTAVSSLVSQEAPGTGDNGVQSILPAPWRHKGIGMTNEPGAARMSAAVIELAGAGGGLGVQGVKDACHFVHQMWQGDGVFTACVLEAGGTGTRGRATSGHRRG